MADISKDLLLNIIKQVGIGMNFCRSYPKDHPGLEPIVSKSLSLIKEMPPDRDEISLCMIENVILFEGERFETEKLPIVKSITSIFNRLGVRSVSFSVGLTVEDLRAFFNTMAATPADLQDYGSIASILEASGAQSIKLNELEYGIVSTKGGKVKIDWDVFLKTLKASSSMATDEATKMELVKFLTDVVGLKGGEPDEVQAEMITNTLEKLSNVVVEKFGEEGWGEYSLIFTRILATLSPNIKSRIAKIKTENKRLAELIRNILPTLSDETLIEIVSSKALSEGEGVDPDVIEMLKRLTGPRLVNLLPQLKDKLPAKALEDITFILSRAAQPVEAELKIEEASHEELEKELRKYFPPLREEASEIRIKAVADIMTFVMKIFDTKHLSLLKLVIDRLDAMSDSERDLTVFSRVVDGLKDFYLKAKSAGMREVYETISKRIGRHLLRAGRELVDRKKIVIGVIGEMHDSNYITELISILWEQGTFNEAREALIKFSSDAIEPLLGVLKDAEDRSVRMKILDVILKMGKPILPAIEKLLRDQEWFVRRNGVYILGEIKAEEMVDEIGKRVADDHEKVQIEAVNALSKIGGDKVKPYLKSALNSKYKTVMLEAINNLPKEDVQSVLPELIKLMERKKRIPDKKEEELRRIVVAALSKIGGNDAVECLVRTVKDHSFIGSDLLFSTKEAAIEALGTIGSERALEVLSGFADGNDADMAALAENTLEKIKRKA